MRSREGLGYKTARQPSCHVGSADRGSSSKHNSSLDSAFYNTVGLLSIDPLLRPSASTTHSPPPSSQRPSLIRWSRVELWRPLLKQLRQRGYGLPHAFALGARRPSPGIYRIYMCQYPSRCTRPRIRLEQAADLTHKQCG